MLIKQLNQGINKIWYFCINIILMKNFIAIYVIEIIQKVGSVYNYNIFISTKQDLASSPQHNFFFF